MTRALAIARAEVLTGGIVLGSLGVTAAVVGPSMINASQSVPEPTLPSDPALARSCESIRELFDLSRAVLASWQPDDAGFHEALVWWQDTEEPGTINRDELILLTLNSTMGTIAAYSWPSDHRPDIAQGLGVVVEEEADEEDGLRALGSSPVPRNTIGAVFPTRWRHTPGITRTLVATDVRTFTVRGVRERGSPPSWRVTVTWGSDLSEVEDDVCSFVVPADA